MANTKAGIKQVEWERMLKAAQKVGLPIHSAVREGNRAEIRFVADDVDSKKPPLPNPDFIL